MEMVNKMVDCVVVFYRTSLVLVLKFEEYGMIFLIHMVLFPMVPKHGRQIYILSELVMFHRSTSRIVWNVVVSPQILLNFLMVELSAAQTELCVGVWRTR